MTTKFEAYINPYGELKDFNHSIVFYQGTVAFLYKKHMRDSKEPHIIKIYGEFMTSDDANDLENGKKYLSFPGYIEYNEVSNKITPYLKSKMRNIWNEFTDVYDIDNLAWLVASEICG